MKAANTATEEVAIVKPAEEEVYVKFAGNAALLLPLLSSKETDPPLPRPHHLKTTLSLL